MVFWFTGLSGAGKTTFAKSLAASLRKAGYRTLLIDGDAARSCLCSDLGYNMEDRAENIRCITSCARLAEESGIVAYIACITPLSEHRSITRERCRYFYEIYNKADLDHAECAIPMATTKKGFLTIQAFQ